VPEDQVSLEEYWNSEKVRRARVQFLKGEIPAECFPCSEHIFYNEQPRNFFFTQYEQLKKQLIEATDEQGHTTARPHFFDYRFSNLCQLACRMCDYRSSSRIEKLYEHESDRPNIESFVRPFIESTLLPEILASIEEGQIDQLYWAGGEPLLSPEHWQVMQRAIEAGVSSKISVIYNTNLGMLKNAHGDLLETVQHFKETLVLASLDGVGELGEFIREGLNWDAFRRNVKALKGVSKVKVMLTITITLPGLLEIEKLAKYIMEEDLEYDVHFASANGMQELFCPLIVPRPLLETIIDQALKNLNSLNDPRADGLTKNISKILEHTTLEERFGADYLPQLNSNRERYLARERQEGKSVAAFYLKHNKDLYDWWTQPIIELIPHQAQLELDLHSDWLDSFQSRIRKGRMGYLSNGQSAMTLHFKVSQTSGLELISLANLEKIPSGTYDIFFLDYADLNWETVNSLHSLLREGGEISLIAPYPSLLNRWIHRNKKEEFYKKVKNSIQYSSQLYRLMPALSYMAKQRRLPKFIVSIIRLLDCLIPQKLIALHGHYVLKK
jgi:sulfatase maturation enzyme AslB (radical SAM superfamily)